MNEPLPPTGYLRLRDVLEIYPDIMRENKTLPLIENLPPMGYLRLRDVLKLYPVSKSTWWQGIKDQIYPPGYRLSSRVTAWRVEDIFYLLENGTWSNQKGYEHSDQCSVQK